MLKIFLVEDEIIIRQGIKCNINWEEEGYIFIGEASDGELAYPMIRELRPDIVITDIKMPFLDGIQLSKLVKKEMPDIRIIILSGYEEFEYAKEAINIGVEEYLLKPVDKNILLEAIKKVDKAIQEEREKQNNILRSKTERMKNIHLKTQQFLTQMITETMSVSEVMNRSMELKLDIIGKQYNIIRYNVFDTNQNNSSYSQRSMELKKYINSQIQKENKVFVIDRINENTTILIKSIDEKDLKENIKRCVNCIIENTKNYEGIEYFVGVGNEVERVSNLPICYEEANKAYAYSYIIDKNKVLYANEIGDTCIINDLDMSNINIRTINKNVIGNFIKTGVQTEVKYIVEEYFMAIGTENMKSLLFRQYVIMDVYFYCKGILEEWKIDEKEYCLGEISKETTIFSTIEAAKDYIYKILLKVIAKRDAISSSTYNAVIVSAKDYIKQNFSKEDISLNTVAKSVDFSPSHFSTLFSQTTGQTFIEYLTEIRMEKAKELLRCSAMRSSEIGYLVGYKDPHYFSFLFKKTQKCTPKEYRKRGVV